MDLRNEILAALSAPQPSAAALPSTVPIEHPDGVIEWTPSYSTHAFFMQLRGERVLSWSIEKAHPLRNEVPRFLAATPDRALEAPSGDRPALRFDEPRFPGGRFSSWAVMHPTVTKVNPSTHPRAMELIGPRAYLVFPCHRSEVARDMDAEWIRQHKLPHSSLERPVHSAFLTSRSPPSKGKKAKAKPRIPGRSPNAERIASQITTGDVLEFENFERRVLRFADLRATLDSGASRPLSGVEDATALLQAFLERDEWLEAPGPADTLIAAELYRQLEASAGDNADGVEQIFIEERATRREVARLFVHLDGATLRIGYTRLDPRLSDALLPDLVAGPYLFALTRHHYRGRAKEIALTPRDDAGPTLTLPYPK